MKECQCELQEKKKIEITDLAYNLKVYEHSQFTFLDTYTDTIELIFPTERSTCSDF